MEVGVEVGVEVGGGVEVGTGVEQSPPSLRHSSLLQPLSQAPSLKDELEHVVISQA